MTVTTYCRICSGLCGLVVEVDGDRVTSVRGDPAHPLSQGYTCTKGRHIGALHARPDRFRTAQRRTADGQLEPIATETALDEVAERLRAIAAEHGPDAIAMFVGTQASTGSLTYPFAKAWWRALGSSRQFSTMTIDQSAKWVTEARLGAWRGGRQRFADADVWLLAGTNPLVSLQGGDLTGVPIHNPARSLKAAQERGLKLIVVDPRRTETAARADVHLQIRPGTDAALYAGMLRLLFEEDLHDAAFCAEHADGVDALRRAVAPMTVERVAAVTGVAPGEIRRATRMFGAAAKGMAASGTGVDMGPFSNLAEHLLSCLNVVCGRFPRAGEPHAHPAVLRAPRPARAEVAPPDRSWLRGPKGRRGHGHLHGELPATTLPDEIAHDGPDRVRALVVVGGNPATCIPDQERTVDALRRLELLVTIEPFPNETAALADYVIAPALALERPDHTRSYEAYFDRPFAAYTDPVLPAPPGVIEDWAVFYELASRMDLTLRIGRRTYPPGVPRPPSEAVLEDLASTGRAPLDEVRAAPHGVVFDDLEPVPIEPAGDTAGRFDVLPADVAAELEEAWAHLSRGPDTGTADLTLVVRRIKATMNSLGVRAWDAPSQRVNPCSMHPDDLARLGLEEGQVVELASDHGRVAAVVAADRSLRPGVASLTHGFGDLPAGEDDPRETGTNPARLLSATEGLQAINAMPVMTAVPVRVRPMTPDAAVSR